MTDLTDDTLDLNSLWDETDDEGVATPAQAAGESEEPEETDDSDGAETEVEETEEESEEDESEEGDEGTEGEEEQEEEVDYEALWKRAQNEVKTMTGRLKATEARLAPVKEQLAPEAPASNSEEDAFLAKFKETYSEDVIKAIDLITTKKASQIVEASLNSRLNPVEAATNEIVAQAHFGAIEAAHPDFEDVDASPVFESWLNTRPIHIRSAYEHIRNHGTPAQVISMLSEYKETIGAAKPKTKTTKVSEAKIAAATAVGRKRGTVQTAAQPDANDLAAIWRETDD